MKRLIVWICDGAIALLSILAIVCYFFAPIWTIKIKVPVTGEQLKSMIGNVEGYDLSEAFDEDLEVNASINIDTKLLFNSVGSKAETVVQKMIDGNVENVVNQLSGPISTISRKVVKSVAKQVVTEKVNEQVKEYLQNNSEAIFEDQEIAEKLEQAGINDEYISEKTGEIFDAIFDSNVDVDTVGDMVVGTVVEAYEKLSESGDVDFAGAELKEEDKEKIKQGVTDALEKLADEEGELNPDEIVDRFLLEFLQGQNKGSGAVRIAPCSQPSETSTRDELINEVRTYLSDKIPPVMNTVIVWGLRGVFALILISSACWLYVLIKVAVKFFTAKEDNTVKLKVPIIFGWLPFILLVIVPSIGFGIAKSMISGKAAEFIGSMTASFASISWIALLCAAICIGISIFFIIERRSRKAAAQPEEETEREVATSSDD